MGVIQLTDISKSYFSKPILQNISLTIEKGDRLALIGENGSGKTTLMKIIAGLEKADSGRISIANGTILSYLSQQMEELVDLSVPVLSNDRLNEMQNHLETISLRLASADAQQEAELLKQYQEVSERFERFGGYTYLPRLAQALARLGIQGDVLERPISTLSGGERMRVLLARRLMENADVLLLDEPTNHLDIDGLEWLEEYLSGYKGTVLFISHDRYFIDRIASKTAEISGANLTLYKGAYTSYLEQKQRNTNFLRQTLDRLESEKERQAEVKQTMLSHRKMSSYHAREKIVANLEEQIESVRDSLPAGERKMSFRFIPKQDKRDLNRVLLKIENAAMAWPDQLPLFSQVNFELKASQKLVLAGPNGCGKSTLLAMIMGRIQNFEGDLSLVSDIRYGHLGQYTKFDNEQNTLLEELTDRTALLETEARNLLARYGFRENDVYKTISVLSGGERSRLYLCCLLEEEPDILFLDEPTNHLDIHSREVLEDAINRFNGAILAVSHDRYFIEKCGFTVYGFLNGYVKPYQSYNSYRHFAHIAQTEKTSQLLSEPTGQMKASNEKLNVVKIRKEKQTVIREIAETETSIHSIEEELSKMQEELTGNNLEVYQKFADLEQELNEIYLKYFDLGSRSEELNRLLEQIAGGVK